MGMIIALIPIGVGFYVRCLELCLEFSKSSVNVCYFLHHHHFYSCVTCGQVIPEPTDKGKSLSFLPLSGCMLAALYTQIPFYAPECLPDECSTLISLIGKLRPGSELLVHSHIANMWCLAPKSCSATSTVLPLVNPTTPPYPLSEL